MHRLQAIGTTLLPWRPQLAPVFCPLLLVVLVTAFYHVWLLVPGLITAGDQPYFTVAHLKDGIPFPSLWDSTLLTGAYNILQAPFFPFYFVQGILASLGMSWAPMERLLWFIPALVVPSASTYALALSLFQRHHVALISALAVIMNSYVYLIYEGGQLGIALGFGYIPLVLWAFIRGQQRGTVSSFVLTGLLMALQAMYDIRSTYISIGILLIYGLFSYQESARYSERSHSKAWRSLGLLQIVVMLTVVAIIHLWWILPALFAGSLTLPPGYADVTSIQPLSLMQLSNALSLFHPFWFTNNSQIAAISPLFFAVPLCIFGLLVYRQRNRHVLFLTTVALIAAFFVKGDNDPGGHIYDWLFLHLPGFSLFRDPSKFYQPLAVAYALLLGLAAFEWSIVIGRAMRTWRLVASALTTVCFLILAVFPAYPALMQQAHGTFAINPVPADYVRLNDFIDSQPTFFRVLWVPARPRFGTTSSLHPALDAGQLSTCCIRLASAPRRLWSWMSSPFTIKLLRSLSVRYIVVPNRTMDSDFVGQQWMPKGIGLTPGAVMAAMQRFLHGLPELQIGRLHVFVNGAAEPLLYTVPANGSAAGYQGCAMGTLDYNNLCMAEGIHAVAQTSHDAVVSFTMGQTWHNVLVRVTHAPVYLVFQETYDRNWLAFVQRGNQPLSRWTILSQHPLPSHDHVVANGYANAWLLSMPGVYHVTLEYWPQQLVLLGWLIAGLALLLYVSVFSYQLWKRRARPARSRRTVHAGAKERCGFYE